MPSARPVAMSATGRGALVGEVVPRGDEELERELARPLRCLADLLGRRAGLVILVHWSFFLVEFNSSC